MQVELIETLLDGKVRVRSPFGWFTAHWRGDRPVVGSTHNVELEVEDPVLWGHDLEVGSGEVNEIVDEAGCVRISARVESLNEDDGLVLDIGGPSFIVDTLGDPPLDLVGRYATLRSRHIALYPYSI